MLIWQMGWRQARRNGPAPSGGASVRAQCVRAGGTHNDASACNIFWPVSARIPDNLLLLAIIGVTESAACDLERRERESSNTSNTRKSAPASIPSSTGPLSIKHLEGDSLERQPEQGPLSGELKYIC